MSNDLNDTTAIRQRIESAIQKDDYAKAVSLYEKLSLLGENNSLIATDWLEWLFCLAMCSDDRLHECRRLLERFPDANGRVSNQCRDVGNAITSMLETGQVLALRSAAERFSQGFRGAEKTEWPFRFSALESRFGQFLTIGEAKSAHDYHVNSYFLWLRGLRETAEGHYKSALNNLTQSVERYQLGQMPGDVLWSQYDIVVCYLFLHHLKDARQHYSNYLKSVAPNRFQRMAETMISAYNQIAPDLVDEVASDLKSGWREYRDTWYPAIFRNFKIMLRKQADSKQQRGRVRKAKTGPTADTSDKQTDHGSKKSSRDGSLFTQDNLELSHMMRADKIMPYWCLVARPTQDTRSEINALKELAGTVDVGNTRPEKIHSQLQISNAKLREELTSWDDALIFFATDLYPPGSAMPILAGSSKIQQLFDDCWIKVADTNAAYRQHLSKTEKLVFSTKYSNALELAGNAVLPQYEKCYIGTFQIQWRLLFAMTYGIEPKTWLIANLLTTKPKSGKYPFFEKAFKPLLGNFPKLPPGVQKCSRAKFPRHLVYDEVDELRYQHPEFIEKLLGPKGKLPREIPIYMLPEAVQTLLGNVKEDTQRVQRTLMRYGFQLLDKFDLLDAGQYIGTSYANLISNCKPLIHNRLAYPHEESQLPNEACWCTFALSDRPSSEFRAARTLVGFEKGRVLIPDALFSILGLNRDERVSILLDPPKN